MPAYRHPARFLTIAACWLASVSTPTAQDHLLTFADRVAAQEAIERVYLSHQIGATRDLDRTVPREVLERKVRTYLAQSAALERYWHTPITGEMLRAEMERIARDTRFPGRLLEMYRALGDDPVLVQETFARASLADRLARGFFAFDTRLHAGPRAEAAALLASLRFGGLDVDQGHPRRTVVEYSSDDLPQVERVQHRLGEPRRVAVSPRELAAIRAAAPRRVGEVTGPTDDLDGFTLTGLLADGPAEVRVALYRVPKKSWDEFWRGVEGSFDPATVMVVALPGRLPRPSLAGAEASDVVTGGAVPSAEQRLQPAAADFCIQDDTWDNGALATGMVAARGASAVWTGTHMIVWGGAQLGQLDTGSRYDPLTDSWQPTTTLDAPAPREGHTAVWTGAKMIVWGGEGADAFQNGGRYDPMTDTWTTLSTVGAPSGRWSHTAVWTGDEMIVWGGVNELYYPPLLFDDGARYDPDSDTWSPISSVGAPAARYYHAAAWSGAEMMIWGGWDGASVLDDGARYDAASNTWLSFPASGAPAARSGHTAIWTGSALVIWGGYGDTSNLRSGAEFDPATNTWSDTPKAGAPSARSDHKAVWTGTEMLVWGGTDDNGNLGTGGAYNPATNDWRALPDLDAPIARVEHVAVWTGALMIVWGGYDPEGHVLFTGGRYDPSSDSWTPTSTGGSPPAQREHTAVWTGTLMLTFGGATAARYDPLIDGWTPITALDAPSARSAHAAIWTGSRMLIWGGNDGGGGTATGGSYDPVADTWSATATAGAPSARWWFAAVWTGTEMVVWGGDSESGALEDGGRYDPIADSWNAMQPAGAPSPRSQPQAVWTGARMIVWGGFYGAAGMALANGARYDPASDAWTAMATVGAPSGRFGAAAVWDGARMLVWGGGGNGGEPARGRQALRPGGECVDDHYADRRAEPATLSHRGLDRIEHDHMGRRRT